MRLRTRYKWSNQQIADTYGVSKGAVARVLMSDGAVARLLAYNTAYMRAWRAYGPNTTRTR